MAIARYVSETAVIRMVDEYEATDSKMAIRQGFRIGWSRTSWRLFLINLIVNITDYLACRAVSDGVGFMIYTMVAGRSETFAVAGIVRPNRCGIPGHLRGRDLEHLPASVASFLLASHALSKMWAYEKLATWLCNGA